MTVKVIKSDNKFTTKRQVANGLIDNITEIRDLIRSGLVSPRFVLKRHLGLTDNDISNIVESLKHE